MNTSDERMTIGRLAEVTGVPASAIRYWERHDLLPQPARESGQRRYLPEAAERIIVLRMYQLAGLTLAEIRDFQQDRPRRQAMIRAKLEDLDQRVLDLERARKLLTHGLQCSKRDILSCPKFKAQLPPSQSSSARGATNCD